MSVDFDRRYACLLAYAQDIHDDFIAENRAVFYDYPPDDKGIYAYTYYDCTAYPIYHGYTTDAPQRARDHWRYAPWASWAEYVRYRRCKTVRQARKLEIRVIRKVDCICRTGYGKVAAFHVGRRGSYRGEEWSARDQEMKFNHVTGTVSYSCCTHATAEPVPVRQDDEDRLRHRLVPLVQQRDVQRAGPGHMVPITVAMDNMVPT